MPVSHDIVAPHSQTPADSLELSVVIPVLNEEDSIGLLIDRVQIALAGIDHEIVIVDDGSTDATRERVRERAGDRLLLVA
ncbi:MAG: glycosyltransferase, partial [Chitinophagia bacterium]|nr:glycosyltransferase [Chitinophagia bacterium]